MGGSKTKVDAIQVIQAVTVLSPIVGGHQQPLKGSLNHPKKVTRRMIRMVILIDTDWRKESVYSVWVGHRPFRIGEIPRRLILIRCTTEYKFRRHRKFSTFNNRKCRYIRGSPASPTATVPVKYS